MIHVSHKYHVSWYWCTLMVCFLGSPLDSMALLRTPWTPGCCDPAPQPGNMWGKPWGIASAWKGWWLRAWTHGTVDMLWIWPSQLRWNLLSIVKQDSILSIRLPNKIAIEHLLSICYQFYDLVSCVLDVLCFLPGVGPQKVANKNRKTYHTPAQCEASAIERH